MKHENISRRSFLRTSGAVTASSILSAAGVAVVASSQKAFAVTSGCATVTIPGLTILPSGKTGGNCLYRITWQMKNGQTTTETRMVSYSSEEYQITDCAAVSGTVELIGTSLW